MSIHIIPINKLSAAALKGVIEEFISRGGTDYGTVESSITYFICPVCFCVVNSTSTTS